MHNNFLLIITSVIHCSSFFLNFWLYKQAILFEMLCLFSSNDLEIQLCVLATQLCSTLWDPMDSYPPGFSIHGIFQAWKLEWIAIPSSRGSSWPRDWTQVSCIAGRLFTIWATREAMRNIVMSIHKKTIFVMHDQLKVFLS